MIPKPLTVILTDADRHAARVFGAKRYEIAKRAGYYRQRRATEDEDRKADQIGLLGELAFGREFNLFADLSWEPRKAGFDFRLGGRTIDVKTTMKDNSGISLEKRKVDDHGFLDVDIFVLAQVVSGQTGVNVDLVGYITRDYFFKLAKLVKFGKDGPESFVLDRDHLDPVEFLKQLS